MTSTEPVAASNVWKGTSMSYDDQILTLRSQIHVLEKEAAHAETQAKACITDVNDDALNQQRQRSYWSEKAGCYNEEELLLRERLLVVIRQQNDALTSLKFCKQICTPLIVAPQTIAATRQSPAVMTEALGVITRATPEVEVESPMVTMRDVTTKAERSVDMAPRPIVTSVTPVVIPETRMVVACSTVDNTSDHNVNATRRHFVGAKRHVSAPSCSLSDQKRLCVTKVHVSSLVGVSHGMHRLGKTYPDSDLNSESDSESDSGSNLNEDNTAKCVSSSDACGVVHHAEKHSPHEIPASIFRADGTFDVYATAAQVARVATYRQMLTDMIPFGLLPVKCRGGIFAAPAHALQQIVIHDGQHKKIHLMYTRQPVELLQKCDISKDGVRTVGQKRFYVWVYRNDLLRMLPTSYSKHRSRTTKVTRQDIDTVIHGTSDTLLMMSHRVITEWLQRPAALEEEVILFQWLHTSLLPAMLTWEQLTVPTTNHLSISHDRAQQVFGSLRHPETDTSQTPLATFPTPGTTVDHASTSSSSFDAFCNAC